MVEREGLLNINLWTRKCFKREKRLDGDSKGNNNNNNNNLMYF